MTEILQGRSIGNLTRHQSLLILAASAVVFIPDTFRPRDDSPPPVTRFELQVDKTRRVLEAAVKSIKDREPQANKPGVRDVLSLAAVFRPGSLDRVIPNFRGLRAVQDLEGRLLSDRSSAFIAALLASTGVDQITPLNFVRLALEASEFSQNHPKISPEMTAKLFGVSLAQSARERDRASSDLVSAYSVLELRKDQGVDQSNIFPLTLASGLLTTPSMAWSNFDIGRKDPNLGLVRSAVSVLAYWLSQGGRRFNLRDIHDYAKRFSKDEKDDPRGSLALTAFTMGRLSFEEISQMFKYASRLKGYSDPAKAARLVLTASFQIKNDYSFFDQVFLAHLTNEYL